MGNLTEILLILGIILLGSIFHGSIGFGFALVSTGLMTTFLSVKDTTLILITLNTLLSIAIVIKYWRFIRVKELIVIFFGGLVGILSGIPFLLYFGETEWLKQCLGFVLIGIVIFLFMNRDQVKGEKIFKIPLLVFSTGLAGGFVSSVFAIGGPFFVIFFLIRFTDKRQYSVNLQITFIILNVITLLLHGIQGSFSSTYYFYMVPGTLVALVGVYIGLRFFTIFKREWIQTIAYIIILLSGINLIILSWV